MAANMPAIRAPTIIVTSSAVIRATPDSSVLSDVDPIRGDAVRISDMIDLSTR
jgi:hypothetical protein